MRLQCGAVVGPCGCRAEELQCGAVVVQCGVMVVQPCGTKTDSHESRERHERRYVKGTPKNSEATYPVRLPAVDIVELAVGKSI